MSAREETGWTLLELPSRVPDLRGCPFCGESVELRVTLAPKGERRAAAIRCRPCRLAMIRELISAEWEEELRVHIAMNWNLRVGDAAP